MKKYDYVLVGSGLYSGVFAYLAGKKGKKCLVVEKRDHIGGQIFCEGGGGAVLPIFTVRTWKASMFIVTARTFSIPATGRSGNL